MTSLIGRYIDRRDYKLVQMDTDSNYLAISGECLEDIVKPELREEFETQKKNWLAWDKWSGCTPGLFKLECTGRRMIALCSKCYYIEESGKKSKFSTKGMSKKQNEITWKRFKEALEGALHLPTHPVGTDTELGQQKGGFFHFFQQASSKLSRVLQKQTFL